MSNPRQLRKKMREMVSRHKEELADILTDIRVADAKVRTNLKRIDSLLDIPETELHPLIRYICILTLTRGELGRTEAALQVIQGTPSASDPDSGEPKAKRAKTDDKGKTQLDTILEAPEADLRALLKVLLTGDDQWLLDGAEKKLKTMRLPGAPRPKPETKTKQELEDSGEWDDWKPEEIIDAGPEDNPEGFYYACLDHIQGPYAWLNGDGSTKIDRSNVGN
ncbi:hypothetical protein QBC39DRAFT_369865 [Podospora conica]|nr:hypothetical protein QBC39DRAFT_369865 [Schizothecium conicum]